MSRKSILCLVLIATLFLGIVPNEAAAGTSTFQGYFNTVEATVKGYFGQDYGWNPELRIVPGTELSVSKDRIEIGADLFSESYAGVPGGKGYYMIAYGLVRSYLDTAAYDFPGDGRSPIWHMNIETYDSDFSVDLFSELVTIEILTTLLPEYDGVNLTHVAETRLDEIASTYDRLGKMDMVEWLQEVVQPNVLQSVVRRIHDASWGLPDRNLSTIPDVYGAPYRTAVLVGAVREVNPDLADRFPLNLPDDVVETAYNQLIRNDLGKLMYFARSNVPLSPIESLNITILGKTYTLQNGMDVLSIDLDSRKYLLGVWMDGSYKIVLNVRYLDPTSLEITPVKYDITAGGILKAGDYTTTITKNSVGKSFKTPLAGYPWELGLVKMYWKGHPNAFLNYRVVKEDSGYRYEGDPGNLRIVPLKGGAFLVTIGDRDGFTFIFGKAAVNVTGDMKHKTYLVYPETGAVIAWNGAPQLGTAEGTTSSQNGWILVGSAYFDPSLNAIVLTPNEWDKAGAAWFDTPVDLATPFVMTAKFYAGTCGGGDGIWVGFQSRSSDALGGRGGDVGIGGVSPAAGFRLWEWQRKVDYYENGRWTTIASDACFADEKEHTLMFSWDPKTSTLKLVIDNQYQYSRVVDLPSVLGSSRAYFGFTAGTGLASNLHYVKVQGVGGEYVVSTIESIEIALQEASKLGADVADLQEELDDIKEEINGGDDLQPEAAMRVFQKLMNIQNEAGLRVASRVSELYGKVSLARSLNLTSISIDVNFEAASSAMLDGNLTAAMEYLNTAYEQANELASSKIQEISTRISDLMQDALRYSVAVGDIASMQKEIETLTSKGDYITAYQKQIELLNELSRRISRAKEQMERSDNDDTGITEENQSDNDNENGSHNTASETSTVSSESDTVSSSTVTEQKHPLAAGDWAKYEVEFEASTGSEKISGKIEYRIVVKNITEEGFTVEYTDIEGDVDEFKQIFGDDIFDPVTIQWDIDPGESEIYADPSKLPEDGTVHSIDFGIGELKYDTKTGLLKEGKISANIFGLEIKLQIKQKEQKSAGSSDSGGICGPAVFVIFALASGLLIRRRL
ncbi:L-type lectin-domain containing protein [Thermococcus sp. JdF3]|uniref:L-type lectin-domain containing protein n=1 Tax=Thermococcus sp. JdF3 TaxID=1638258 RepID=UPI00143AECE5|nr:L-type lectin-domain containing protein [Thermococcus sp. JdF3]NJE00813.1 hypothetical protein [Thermococcus sp. JdF3]